MRIDKNQRKTGEDIRKKPEHCRFNIFAFVIKNGKPTSP